jgi:hypothetical protein
MQAAVVVVLPTAQEQQAQAELVVVEMAHLLAVQVLQQELQILAAVVVEAEQPLV